MFQNRGQWPHLRSLLASPLVLWLSLVLSLAAQRAVPHHSTFSKNRHGRFRNAGVFRILFEQGCRNRCLVRGLRGAEEFQLDAAIANLVLLTRPIDQPTRAYRPPLVP